MNRLVSMRMYVYEQVRTLIQMQSQFPSQLKTNVRFTTQESRTKAEAGSYSGVKAEQAQLRGTL